MLRGISVLAVLLLTAGGVRADKPWRLFGGATHPPAQPLGVLAGEAVSIQVMRVVSEWPAQIRLKVSATLKNPEEADASPMQINAGYPLGKLFREGGMALFIRMPEYGLLHLYGRWALVVWPDRGWALGLRRCLEDDMSAQAYVGPTRDLIRHVEAILSGEEVAITARPPRREDGGPRLWRIKAGLRVTHLVLSDKSPHFVAWGGGPDEPARLTRQLNALDPQERIRAANGLADIRPASGATLTALRRAMRDPVPEVALSAAATLARLAEDDEDAINFIVARLRVPKESTRQAAVMELGELGRRARMALPAVLAALDDTHTGVRSLAARAAGAIGRHGAERAAVAALAARLEAEPDPRVVSTTLAALHHFGPLAWEAAPSVFKKLAKLTRQDDSDLALMVLELLDGLEPFPVETMAAALRLERQDSEKEVGAHILRRLGMSGTRARSALPTLRRLLPAAVADARFHGAGRLYSLADALLRIDPEHGPDLVREPVQAAMRSARDPYDDLGARILVRCSTSRPAARAVLSSLHPDDTNTLSTARALLPLLTPSDRDLLPRIKEMTEGLATSLLAEALLQFGLKKEATAEASALLGSPGRLRVSAARVLGKLGRDAGAGEAALLRALSASEGAERAHLLLALWQVKGSPGGQARRRALEALDGLLDVTRGGSGDDSPRPAISRIEGEALGAAIGSVVVQLLKTDDITPALKRMLDHEEPRIRLAAAVGLARAAPGDPAIVPALLRLLAAEPHFLCHAADTVAALGPAPRLATTLASLMKLPDADLSRVARTLLRRIGKQPPLPAGLAPADLAPSWADLASADPVRADMAVWRLACAGPKAVEMLRKSLRPPPAVTKARLARLLRDLDDDDFDTRQRAGDALAGAFESAAPSLRKALPTATLEVRMRLTRLIDSLEDTPPPEQRRRQRALRVLEEVGTADARALVARLAKDDGEHLPWDEAARVLRRMGPR